MIKYMWVCTGVHAYTCACMWKSDENLSELVLSIRVPRIWWLKSSNLVVGTFTQGDILLFLVMIYMIKQSSREWKWKLNCSRNLMLPWPPCGPCDKYFWDAFLCRHCESETQSQHSVNQICVAPNPSCKEIVSIYPLYKLMGFKWHFSNISYILTLFYPHTLTYILLITTRQ